MRLNPLTTERARLGQSPRPFNQYRLNAFGIESPAVGAAGLETIALDWVGVGGPAR